jgi:hypothetical protein
MGTRKIITACKNAGMVWTPLIWLDDQMMHIQLADIVHLAMHRHIFQTKRRASSG